MFWFRNWIRTPLEDRQRLLDHDVNEGCVISLIEVQRGGGIKIVDIEKQLRIVKPCKGAPKWRRVKKGFCAEGKCTTQVCPAYQQHVLCSFGFGMFNIEELLAKCPLCNEVVQSCKNFGFNNCLYRIRAIKLDSTNSINISWTKVANVYHTWDEEKAGVVEYNYMEIEVRHLRREVTISHKGIDFSIAVSEDCAFCLEAMQAPGSINNNRVLRCGHSFHMECWESWRAHQSGNDLPASCPLCRFICD